MFKKSLLALAIIASSQSAFAAADGTTGNGNLILAARGLNAGGAEVTLAYNTGLFLDTFEPAYGGNAADIATLASFTQNLGSAWTTFSAAVASPSSIQWAVFASDTTPAATNTSHRFLGTTNLSGSAITALGTPGSLINGSNEYNTMGAGMNLFITNNNNLVQDGSNVSANTFGGNTNQGGFVVSVSGTSAAATAASYTTRNIAELGMNPAAVIGFDPDAGLGESRQFMMIRRNLTSSSSSQPAQLDDFSANGAFSTWSLSNAGVLSFNVAPIPEPGEWAMMLAGMGIIGAIARRRRSV